MRFSVQLLAIAATVLSFNATPREATLQPSAWVMAPVSQPAAGTIDEEAREATASTEAHSPGTSPFAWVLGAGFLALVILRRTRSLPLD